MKLLNSKKMLGVSVITRAGRDIGKVASFDVDATTGRLVTLHVKTRGLVSGLLQNELLVSWDAVLEMTEARVVIADAAIAATAKDATTTSAPVKPMTSSPTFMREEPS